jgi:uncharacterized Zn-binding protein involved in type VI secretion
VGVLLVGASLAVGYYTGELATAARDSIADAGASSMTKKGVITSGSPNVFINGKPAALATDSTVDCSDDGSQQMAEGSKRVSINSQPASRIEDRTTCDAKVMTGSDNVIIGGDPQQTLPIQSEVPGGCIKSPILPCCSPGLSAGGAVPLAKSGRSLSCWAKSPVSTSWPVSPVAPAR